MNEVSLTTVLSTVDKTVKCNLSDKMPAIVRAKSLDAGGYVPHLSPGQVHLMAVIADKGKHGVRNSLLIRVVFDGALRVSEALGLRKSDIQQTTVGYLLNIRASESKGCKPGTAAISSSTAFELRAYASNLNDTERIFNISRSQAFRVIQAAYEKAGIHTPNMADDRVGAVHALRHSGAIARLQASGNPRSVQEQLRHKSAAMTMRYLKTISHDESMAVQQGVNIWNQ